MAAPRTPAATDPAPTGAAPDAPDARVKTVSLVLVSPSTESWSHVRAATGRSRPHKVAGSRAGSGPGAPPRPWGGGRPPAAPAGGWVDPVGEMTPPARPTPPRGSPDVVARWARDNRTGAAANVFGVKTAATAAGPDVVTTTARSGRPEALIPVAIPPALKPSGMAERRSTGGRSAEDAGTMGCSMVVMARGAAVRRRPSRAG